MKTMLERLRNVGTIISLASLIVLLLTITGVVAVDSDKVMNVIYIICSIGTILGVLNNPKDSGIDLPGIDYPVYKKPVINIDSIDKLAKAADTLNAEKGLK